MPSKKSTKSSENARGKARKDAPVKRAPKTREAALAQAANDYARPNGAPSFGAPVSATQVAYYEKAAKQLRKTKTLAQWLGFKSADAAKRQLGAVARGATSSRTLPTATREAFAKLDLKLDALHNADGRKNKTWPRKHAIVFHALLSEKPTRKPAKRAPKPAQTTEPTPAPASAE